MYSLANLGTSFILILADAWYCNKIFMFVDLQILQAADERREAELYQKDEEIRQKNTQLEQVQVKILYYQ